MVSPSSKVEKMARRESDAERSSVQRVLTRDTFTQPPTIEAAIKDVTVNPVHTHPQDDRRNMSSDLSVENMKYDTSALPEEMTAMHYLEAKAHFQSHRPPFLQTNRGSALASVTAILATRNGTIPEDLAMIKIVVRPWSAHEKYWTLDLDGERLIVKQFAGGRYGSSVRSWLGVKKGFSKYSVAFAPRDDSQELGRSRRADKSAIKGKVSRPGKMRDKDPSLSSGSGSRRAELSKMEEASRKIPTIQRGRQANSLKSGFKPSRRIMPLQIPSRKPKNLVSIPKTSRVALSEGENTLSGAACEAKLARIRQRCAEIAKRKAKNTDEGSRHPPPLSMEATRNRSENEKTEDEEFSDEESSGVQGGLLFNRTPTKNKRKREHSESGVLDDALYNATPQTQPKAQVTRKTKPVLQRSHLPNSTTAQPPLLSPLSSQTSPPLESSFTFTLPADKITQTILLVSQSLSPNDFIPLSLRSCMTMNTFFTSVLDASDIEEPNLEKVKVSFAWTPGKKLVMKRSLADIFFEEFLRTIDEAPCWNEGKRCKVNVEIFVKKND